MKTQYSPQMQSILLKILTNISILVMCWNGNISQQVIKYIPKINSPVSYFF